MTIFVIEDEAHSELCGEFPNYKSALAELKKRAQIPWGEKPNVCPCTNWKTCGRNYEIIEYDNTKKPWDEKARTQVLEVSSRGIVWSKE
ncbi:MAG: hypothetical protein GY936_06040 [Ignavibacteriae bacterium]|nr:hypothetical protein [Ignavibacteriota bacterium]